jgi:hypothetical protein
LDSCKIKDELEGGAENRYGIALASSIVTIAAGMVIGESHQRVGIRLKKSSMVYD